MKGCQMQLELQLYSGKKKINLYLRDGKEWGGADRDWVKKCCLELFPLEHCWFWLPGVALQAYQISLFCIVLNIPEDVLLDSGNSLTFKSSHPWKSFRITWNFFFFLWIFVLNAVTASWCKVPFWNRTVRIPWAQKGRASQWYYNWSSKGKISTRSLKVIRYHPSPWAELS